jgi:hypothetical protein
MDTVNARLLWKRIPKSVKEVEGAAPSSQLLILREIWAIGQSLTLKEFGVSFRQIKVLIT